MTSPGTAHDQATRRVMTAAVGAFALVLAGCSGSHEDPTASPSPTTAQPIVDVLDDEERATAGLTVMAEGQDVLMLRLGQGAQELEGEQREALTGTLTVGPGGCLAIHPEGQSEGAPELLIVDASIGFTDPPRIRVEDAETQVGEELSAQATSVQLTDVEGVPQQCSRDAADTAWVVHPE